MKPNFLPMMTISLLCFSLFSCLKRGRVGDAMGNGSGLLATIDGMDEGDDKLAGIEYWLACKNGYKQKGTIANDAKMVNFPDAGLAANDECFMEITGNATPGNDLKYTWQSKPPKEGLFYSSNYAKVSYFKTASGEVSFHLTFKLFKVYGVEYADSFPALVKVNFEVDAAADIPANKEMVANLECEGGKKRYVSNGVKGDAGKKEREFTFSLSKQLMTGKACEKLVIARNNFVLFSGEINAKFADLEVGKEISFGPFKVKSHEELQGIARCQAKNPQGQCTHIILPRSSGNVWFAVMATELDEDGDTFNEDVLLTGMAGIGLDLTANSVSIDELQYSFDSQSSLYSLYKSEASDKITKSEYKPEKINDDIKDLKTTHEKRGFKYFKEVYVHGFKSISESNLNAMASARWLARITAKKGPLLQQFLLAGPKNYFFSANHPSGSKFYSEDTLIHYLGGSNTFYQAYGTAGDGISSNACALNFDYYVNTLSGTTLAEMSGLPTDQKLEACRLVGDKLRGFKSGYDFHAVFFVWDWHRFDF